MFSEGSGNKNWTKFIYFYAHFMSQGPNPRCVVQPKQRLNFGKRKGSPEKKKTRDKNAPTPADQQHNNNQVHKQKRSVPPDNNDDNNMQQQPLYSFVRRNSNFVVKGALVPPWTTKRQVFASPKSPIFPLVTNVAPTTSSLLRQFSLFPSQRAQK